jgi:hypothetical protein
MPLIAGIERRQNLQPPASKARRRFSRRGAAGLSRFERHGPAETDRAVAETMQRGQHRLSSEARLTRGADAGLAKPGKRFSRGARAFAQRRRVSSTPVYI